MEKRWTTHWFQPINKEPNKGYAQVRKIIDVNLSAIDVLQPRKSRRMWTKSKGKPSG
jgi:hypothetical protein